jgi:peptide/nickel transport system permease protein
MATMTAVMMAIPLGTISAVKQEYLGRLCGPGLFHCRYRHAVFLARHLAHPGHPDHVEGVVRGALDAAHHLRAIWIDPLHNLSMLIWPALATGYRYSAVATRMTRSAMLEVLREDYVRTARAKGLFRKVIVRRHALRNALLPVITVIGIEFAFLMGGLVVTEQVFNLNGLGKLFVESVSNHDYTMTQALVMLVVIVFALTNLVVDITYAWLDPRIRYNR